MAVQFIVFCSSMKKGAEHSALVKAAAQKYGFDFCGIATAQPLDEDARRLERWLEKGMHGGMQYMANHFDLRIDPTKLVPGARSVITVLKNYYPPVQQQGPLKIARYAFGEDYHDVIRTQLNQMMKDLRTSLGDFAGRGFVDSAPVLERTWAQKSGLGWIGKNGNLINKRSGSFFFIATIITDLDLATDDPFARDYCGSCTKCIDACPTEAILPDKTVNGSQCISYFTIELKDEIIPGQMRDRFQNWIFGCDICQEVCPWNRFSSPHQEPAFKPLREILFFDEQDWKDLREDAFKTIFRHSPLKRSKFKGLQRNIRFVLQPVSEAQAGPDGHSS